MKHWFQCNHAHCLSQIENRDELHHTQPWCLPGLSPHTWKPTRTFCLHIAHTYRCQLNPLHQVTVVYLKDKNNQQKKKKNCLQKFLKRNGEAWIKRDNMTSLRNLMNFKTWLVKKGKQMQHRWKTFHWNLDFEDESKWNIRRIQCAYLKKNSVEGPKPEA